MLAMLKIVCNLLSVTNKTRGNDQSFSPKLTEFIHIFRRFPVLVLNTLFFFLIFKLFLDRIAHVSGRGKFF